MSDLISDLIGTLFACKEFADVRACDLERVMTHGGRINPQLGLDQAECERQFKELLDRYIDARIEERLKSRGIGV